MTIKSKLLTDSLGRGRTMSLFKETIPSGSPFEPVYTLGDQPQEGLPSAKRIYLKLEDPTEYKAAMKLVGDWEVWKRMTESEWFKPYIEKWRDELEVQLRAKYLKMIGDMAQSNNEAQAMKAIQFLYKEISGAGSKPGKAPKRGRPSKAEVEREKKIRAQVEQETEEDLNRIRLDS